MTRDRHRGGGSDLGAVRTAVETVVDPDFGVPLAELPMLREIGGGRDDVRITVALAAADLPGRDELTSRITAAVAPLADGRRLHIVYTDMTDDERKALVRHLRGEGKRTASDALPAATRVLAVASGKGGVGKSSVTANLAVALAQTGKAVGIVDADVWGFSIPAMLGLERPPSAVGGMLVPPRTHGVKVISMDFFVEDDQAVIWRGPMLHKALEQFIADVYWGNLDYLLLDLPPGTGDVSISLAQFLPRTEVVVVTTPQPTAGRVARRAGLMASHPNVRLRVIGVVENMSWFTADDGTRYELFGAGGGARVAEEFGVPLLGQIPFTPALREGADHGDVLTATQPDSDVAAAFRSVANAILAIAPRRVRPPELKLV